jgi:hypothetical protein
MVGSTSQNKKFTKESQCPKFTSNTFGAFADIRPILEIFLNLTKKYSTDDILVHEYISDLHTAISKIRAKALKLSPTRRVSCQVAASKLEKYLRRALHNDWLCAAFGE